METAKIGFVLALFMLVASSPSPGAAQQRTPGGERPLDLELARTLVRLEEGQKALQQQVGGLGDRFRDGLDLINKRIDTGLDQFGKRLDTVISLLWPILLSMLAMLATAIVSAVKFGGRLSALEQKVTQLESRSGGPPHLTP
jgi:hypothetical protein